MEEKNVVTVEEKKTETPTVAKKEKKSAWQIFLNFLMMGGFLLILVLGVVIAIVVSLVFKCK